MLHFCAVTHNTTAVRDEAPGRRPTAGRRQARDGQRDPAACPHPGMGAGVFLRLVERRQELADLLAGIVEQHQVFVSWWPGVRRQVFELSESSYRKIGFFLQRDRIFPMPRPPRRAHNAIAVREESQGRRPGSREATGQGRPRQARRYARIQGRMRAFYFSDRSPGSGRWVRRMLSRNEAGSSCQTWRSTRKGRSLSSSASRRSATLAACSGFANTTRSRSDAGRALPVTREPKAQASTPGRCCRSRDSSSAISSAVSASAGSSLA